MFEYVITGLAQGVPYYVRVFANNSVGAGAAAAAAPAPQRPRTAPAPLGYGSVLLRPVLADATTSVLDAATSIELLWTPSLDDRGDAVSAYHVEWFSAPGRDEVQTVSLANATGGTFTLGWDGETTDALAWDATAADVKTALEGLVSIPAVEVELTPASAPGSAGYAITFTGVAGDLAAALTLTPSLLPAATATSAVARGLNTPVAGTGGVWRATTGSVTITSTTSGDVTGSLAPGAWVEVRTSAAAANVGSTSRVAAVSYTAAGTLMTVTLAAPFPGPTATGAFLISGPNVIGAEPLGYLEALIPAEDMVADAVADVRTSVNQAGHFRYVLRGLTPATRYYVRLAAANDRGYSAPQSSLPAALAPPRQKPDAPTRVTAHAQGGAALRVLYYAPASDGGEAVTKYLVEWDVRPGFDSAPGGGALGYQEVAVSAASGDCTVSPCESVIGGLAQGTPYHVRVYAYNAFGYSGRAALTTPPTTAPRTYAAAPPSVTLAQAGDTALTVSFPASPNDGGAPVSKYLVEWDLMGADAVTLGGSTSRVLYSLFAVQAVKLAAPRNDATGVFRLGFGAFSTGDIAVDASAAAVAAALSALPPVGRVEVDRTRLDGPDEWGFVWRVSFTGAPGRTAPLTVSTDGGATFLPLMSGAASAGALAPAAATVAVTALVDADAGFEQQEVTLAPKAGASSAAVAAGPAGHFSLSFDGRATHAHGGQQFCGQPGRGAGAAWQRGRRARDAARCGGRHRLHLARRLHVAAGQPTRAGRGCRRASRGLRTDRD
jgi:hypothetical protein